MYTNVQEADGICRKKLERSLKDMKSCVFSLKRPVSEELIAYVEEVGAHLC